MIEKITGIVMDVIRHNDRSNVVVLYTRSRGRMVMISSGSVSKGNKARNGRLLPLAVISADVNIVAGREMQRLSSFALAEVWHDIYFHPEKVALNLFLKEFLGKLLRESPPDEALFDFIVESLRELDEEKGDVGDMHLRFLSGLLRFMGIHPDVSGYTEQAVFDMRGGNYVVVMPGHADCLTGNRSGMPLLWEAYSRGVVWPQRPFSRRMVLDGLLRYYAIHFPGLGNLKSPEILRTLLSS